MTQSSRKLRESEARSQFVYVIVVRISADEAYRCVKMNQQNVSDGISKMISSSRVLISECSLIFSEYTVTLLLCLTELTIADFEQRK